MNECERLEQFSKRLINVWGLDSKRIEIWKKWRIRRENKNLWTLREYKIQGKGLRIKFHRWCETQVLIGWNFLVSHHDIEYSFVFTPCYQSPLCFTCSILANSSKTLHQSSNKDSVSMCCLLLGYSLEPRLNSRALCTAGSSVMIISLSISVWNGSSHSEYQFDKRKEDWQVQKFEVRWLYKAWRQFSSTLRLFLQ